MDKPIPTVQINFRAPASWPPILRQIAGENDLDVSQLIRRAIVVHWDLAGAATRAKRPSKRERAKVGA